MTIRTVTCPHCQGLSKVDDAQPHASFRCPHCHGVLALATSESPPLMTASELQCPLCAGRFQLPANLAGNLVKCPHCTETVRVPNRDRQSIVNLERADEVRSPISAVDANEHDQRIRNASSREVGAEQLHRSPVESTPPPISPSRPQTRPMAPVLNHESKQSPLPYSDSSFVITVGDQQVTLHDKGKTVEYRGAKLQVQEVSRAERTRRRRLRNFVLGAGFLVVLVMAAALLIRFG